MRSPAALLATLAALALAAVPAVAAEPAAADPAPATPAPLAYPMTPVPYFVPSGMMPVPYGAPYAAPSPYGAWMRPALVEGKSNNAMRIAGIVFFTLGAVTTTAGVVVLNGSVLDNGCDFEPEPVEDHNRLARRGRRGGLGVAREALSLCEAGPVPGAVTIAVGALLGVVGVPLFVIGNKAVLTPMPAMHLGAGTLNLHWSF